VKFLGRVVKPAQEPISAALDIIREEQRKTPYDSKEKWLKFTVDAPDGEALNFLKAVKSRLVSQYRRAYGTSRTLNVVVQVEETPVLYVDSNDRY
jgi:hypothetical protein